jgi:hypothetical protein
MTKANKEIVIRRKIKNSFTHINRGVLLDFFMIYSRFEYALKKAGYIPESEDMTDVSVD